MHVSSGFLKVKTGGRADTRAPHSRDYQYKLRDARTHAYCEDHIFMATWAVYHGRWSCRHYGLSLSEQYNNPCATAHSRAGMTVTSGSERC